MSEENKELGWEEVEVIVEEAIGTMKELHTLAVDFGQICAQLRKLGCALNIDTGSYRNSPAKYIRIMLAYHKPPTLSAPHTISATHDQYGG